MTSIKDIVKAEKAKQPPADRFVSHKGFYEKLLSRDPDPGGQTLLALGPMGSGKTSLLFNLVQDLLKNDNGEKIYWRGTFAAEFSKFPKSKILVDDKLYPLEIYEDGRLTKEIEQTKFGNFSELVANADPSQLNVIYMNDEVRTWSDFIVWLYKHNQGWASVFLDESEDVIPNYAVEEDWHSVQRFGYAFKHSRKRRTSIYLAAQNVGDVFWLIAQKSVTYAFLPGSRRYGPSCLQQRAINNLVLGEVYLTRGALFEKRAFPAFVPPKKDLVIRNLPDPSSWIKVHKPPNTTQKEATTE